jgi:hypothetical protein
LVWVVLILTRKDIECIYVVLANNGKSISGGKMRSSVFALLLLLQLLAVMYSDDSAQKL